MNLERTKKALAIFDEADKAYEAESDGLDNGEAHNRLVALDKLGAAVGEAFAHDTADRNSFDTASLTRPGPWLRKLVADHGDK